MGRKEEFHLSLIDDDVYNYDYNNDGNDDVNDMGSNEKRMVAMTKMISISLTFLG